MSKNNISQLLYQGRQKQMDIGEAGNSGNLEGSGGMHPK